MSQPSDNQNFLSGKLLQKSDIYGAKSGYPLMHRQENENVRYFQRLQQNPL